MKVKSIQIKNIKSFDEKVSELELSHGINVLLGPNNAGKSIILQSILELQYEVLDGNHRRFGKQSAEVIRKIVDISQDDWKSKFAINRNESEMTHFTKIKNHNKIRTFTTSELPYGDTIGLIPSQEPINFIYPFLSKRKVMKYDESVQRGKANQVSTNLQYLVSKVNRISNPNHPLYKDFIAISEDIVGFSLTAIVSQNGQKVGRYVDTDTGISIEEMGEGVSHLLGIIVDLCMAENKLFIIEEIENDIHPKALKKLLNLIIKKSHKNQFVISTHSNIVAKYLGSLQQSKLFRVDMKIIDRIPTTTVEDIGNDPIQRRKVLEELGYEMTDYDLWDAWLILEESTAERLINDYLIPTFVPQLKGKVRTISAGGVDNVEPKFIDFDRLFLFTHLSPQYKNKAWVIVDNCERGEEVISKLKNSYCSPKKWNEANFTLLKKSDIEMYYPDMFTEKVKSVLSMNHGKKKQKAKADLLLDVLRWCNQNKEIAKKSFSESAEEIIEILKFVKKSI